MKSSTAYFSELVKQYSQPLYWHIRRIVVNHEDAQDVLQDTLMRAYRKIWMVREEKTVRAWLYRIATNEALRFLSKNYRYEALPEELERKLLDSEYVDYTQKAEIELQKALLKLSPLQRTVFNLRYYEEMDYLQIAKITDSSEGSVKVSYHNAKERIKKQLDIDL